MTLYTNSNGMLKRKKQIEICLKDNLFKLNKLSVIDSNSIFIGWGNKEKNKILMGKANKLMCKNLSLEDGFIGYIGHPSQNGKAISLVSDKSGIYYDATVKSDLETMIYENLSSSELKRTKTLLKSLTNFGITKYNCYPYIQEHNKFPLDLKMKLAGRKFVLLIDQVDGDLSLSGALANKNSFSTMIKTARKYYPDAEIVVRVHPDTKLGCKKGILANMNLENVILYEEICHPHVLIKSAEAIFTVSSQIGFEALWFDKKVFCFGMPFYAGWGLTIDSLSSINRNNKIISLEQLVHAALIKYTTYFNPVLERTCSIEEVIELIKLQKTSSPIYLKLYLVGFSFWKRAFMKQFCKKLSKDIVFVSTPPQNTFSNEKVIVWGKKFPYLNDVIRVEDGFIRSAGLGSNLCRPSSLIFDDVGIYFDATKSNNLRDLCNYLDLKSIDVKRTENLIRLITRLDINKYHLVGDSISSLPKKTQKKILVIGQVDNDASIEFGSHILKSNEELLLAVRNKNPDAYILYKAHPDVISGNREGFISKSCYTQCVDQSVEMFSLKDLYSYIDELHTITSLTGFEALLRNVNVVTWGQPFYSGWGLTQDQYPPKDRIRQLSLYELCFISLIEYPIYIDWDSTLKISPEILINKINLEKRSSMKISKAEKWQLKISHFLKTISNF